LNEFGETVGVLNNTPIQFDVNITNLGLRANDVCVNITWTPSVAFTAIGTTGLDRNISEDSSELFSFNVNPMYNAVQNDHVTIKSTITYADDPSQNQEETRPQVDILLGVPVLSVDLIVHDSAITVGENVTVTVNVTNIGSMNASNVSLTIEINESCFINLTCCNASMGSIGIGQSKTVNFTLHAHSMCNNHVNATATTAYSTAYDGEYTPITDSCGVDADGDGDDCDDGETCSSCSGDCGSCGGGGGGGDDDDKNKTDDTCFTVCDPWTKCENAITKKVCYHTGPGCKEDTTTELQECEMPPPPEPPKEEPIPPEPKPTPPVKEKPAELKSLMLEKLILGSIAFSLFLILLVSMLPILKTKVVLTHKVYLDLFKLKKLPWMTRYFMHKGEHNKLSDKLKKKVRAVIVNPIDIVKAMKKYKADKGTATHLAAARKVRGRYLSEKAMKKHLLQDKKTGIKQKEHKINLGKKKHKKLFKVFVKK